MGLDISSGNMEFRAGSYNGFHDFRNWLAKQIGFEDLGEYYTNCDKLAGKMNQKTGTYSGASRIPLGPLLFHSDCDGSISINHAKKLLAQLTEIKTNLKKLPPKSKKAETEQETEIWHRESLNNWIKTCRESIQYEDPIRFG